MPKESVSRLIAESGRAKAHGVADAIREGSSIWMLGSPAPAPKGLVGLAPSSTQTVYFQKDDVLDALEDGERFLVKLREDASLLVREEQVVKMRRPPECGCSGETESAIARTAGGTSVGNPGTGPIVIDCTKVCSYEIVCRPYRHKRTGTVIMICSLELVCVDPCKGIPA